MRTAEVIASFLHQISYRNVYFVHIFLNFSRKLILYDYTYKNFINKVLKSSFKTQFLQIKMYPLSKNNYEKSTLIINFK